jgi:hypothetical protein
MTEDSQTQRLRIEMLRMRAALERAQVSAAMTDLRDSTQRVRALASAASNVGAALSGQGDGWVSMMAGAVRPGPMLATLALSALRSARRHPWMAIAAVGAIAIGIYWVRKERSPEVEQTPATRES